MDGAGEIRDRRRRGFSTASLYADERYDNRLSVALNGTTLEAGTYQSTS